VLEIAVSRPIFFRGSRNIEIYFLNVVKSAERAIIMRMIKVSCVIPAYNEAPTIANTLQVATDAGNILDEIIVVDDGSIDDTRKIVGTFSNVRLLVNERNQGKSKTIARGVTEASGEYILMLDADLKGLNAENIRSLIRPVADGVSDIVVSMRGNTPGWMRAIGIDCMSGERVLPKSLFTTHMEKIGNLRNFGLEVFLNKIIIENKLRVKTVMMANVFNNMKVNKLNFWRGLWGEILMWRDIFKTVSLSEFISQNIELRKLLVK